MRKLVAIVSLVALIPFLASCHATPKRIAYTSLLSVAQTVDAARGAYVNYYKSHTVSPEVHAKIVTVDKKYSAAMALAIDAAQFNYSAPASSDLIGLANDLVTSVDLLTKGK